MVELRDLWAGYSAEPILRGISLMAEPGQVTALIGPNGCGKTTLLRTVSGILSPKSGQIIVCGEDISRQKQNAIARRVTYMPQNRQVPDITVQRLVLHGRFPYLSYPRSYTSQDYRIARESMDKLGIGAFADRPLSNLSGGQQQKVYFAMALTQATDVVLLDEPTAYLDVAHQLQVLGQGRALAQMGKTVIMVIHDLAQAMEYADRIVLLERGSVVCQDTPEAVYGSGELDRVFGIKLRRMYWEGRWRYFCTEDEKTLNTL